MRGFLYYLPGMSSSGLTRAEAKRYGVEHAFTFERDMASAGSCPVQPGPDGASGVVVLRGDADATRHGYFKDSQTWSRIHGCDAWIGFETDAPPRPEDLVREKYLLGHEVELGDDNAWMCPMARGASWHKENIVPYIAVPQSVSVDPDSGEWVEGDPLPRYAKLWALAEKWWDIISSAAMGNDNTLTFDFKELCAAAITCLETNYRVTLAEVSALGLFTTDRRLMYSVVEALVDWPKWIELLKKKRLASEQEAQRG